MKTIALDYRRVDRLPRHNRYHLLPYDVRWTSGLCLRGRQLVHRCNTRYCDSHYVGCPVFAYMEMYGVKAAGGWRYRDYGVYVADDVAAGLDGIATSRELRLTGAPLLITRPALRHLRRSGIKVVRSTP